MELPLSPRAKAFRQLGGDTVERGCPMWQQSARRPISSGATAWPGTSLDQQSHGSSPNNTSLVTRVRAGESVLWVCRDARVKAEAGTQKHPRPHSQQPPRRDLRLWCTEDMATATAESATQLVLTGPTGPPQVYLGHRVQPKHSLVTPGLQQMWQRHTPELTPIAHTHVHTQLNSPTVHMHTCTHTRTHTCMHAHTCALTPTRAGHIHNCVPMCTHSRPPNSHAGAHSRYMCTHTCTHTSVLKSCCFDHCKVAVRFESGGQDSVQLRSLLGLL